MLWHCLIGRAAQGLHGHINLAVEIPQVVAVNLILQRGHFIGGFIRIVHGQFVKAIKLGFFLGHTQHDVFAHCEGFIELRLLGQIAHLCALRGPCLAREVLVPARHNPQQCGFTCAVDTDHTDFHTGQEAEADILEAFLATRIGLRDTVHVVDILIGGHACVVL